MKIGMIDFGGIDENSNGIEAIHNTIENVQMAEEFGFSRYWLTEHYIDGVAWRTPELIISLIAGFTNTIKLGCAGVITALNLPYRVAQDYTLLANLFPGRIDLGFARGSGAPVEKLKELMSDIRHSDFYDRVLKIKEHIENKNEHLSVTPPNGFMPDMWMLGTSGSSIEFAAEQKMNFSLSLFHTIEGELPSPEIIANYKNTFFEKNKYEPSANIVFSVFCSTNEERIEQERLTRKNVRLNVSGSPQECLSEIENVRNKYEVDEVIILNLGYKQENRLLMETLKPILSESEQYLPKKSI
jgi:luciferase family oxidoreductase group 1